MPQTLTEAILQKTETRAAKQYLSCEAALAIAAAYNVKPAEVGRICNEEKIKIQRCQLGCF